MQEKTFFTGFGGQGIILLGQIWAFCAMQEGKKVTFFPFYGAEKRGGIAQANVIISDSEIASPIVSKADSVVVMDQSGMQIAENKVRAGGVMLLNTSLITKLPTRDDITIVKIPAFDIAKKIGNDKASNMVMLGALAVLTKAVTLINLKTTLAEFFPESKHNLIPLNVQAIIAGQNTAQNLL
jgi:2-oxoglutarate ferredoxin oxidoreductase subunit gamma